MPFYEYQCTACEHRLEALQKIVDAPLLYCPECGEASLKKLISKAGFRLKGSGWYATDFKDNGKQPKKDGDAKSPPDKTASNDQKTGASKNSPSSEPAQKSA